MAIKSIDTTNATFYCPAHEATEQTVTIASLVAGTGRDKNDIQLPAFSCGDTLVLTRAWESSDEFTAALNGLHRHLVTLAQTHATWAAELAAESDASKPKAYYVLSGTPKVPKRYGTQLAFDVQFMVAVYGIEPARARAEANGFLTGSDNAAIAEFMEEIYAEETRKDATATKLSEERASKLGV